MKVIGKGYVHEYGPADERPHAPGSEELWQESTVLFMWDVEQKVYVFLRMSQEPNRGGKGGYTTVWLNAWTPECSYKHTDDSIPFASGDRTETALRSGGGLCRYEYTGTHDWTVNDGDVRMQLSMKDYHPGIGYFADNVGALVHETARHHIEATGWVTGSVTIKGKTYQVGGTGWRDHSWGPRSWRGIRAHRFYPAMFGKDFNFFCTTFVGSDGKLAKTGLIIRGDSIEATSDYDIVAYMGEDGISNCGGQVKLRLDGKTHVIDYAPIGKAAISLHQDFPCVDAMCIVTMDGKTGVGVSETSHRPQGGTERPFVFPSSPGLLENGLFPR